MWPFTSSKNGGAVGAVANGFALFSFTKIDRLRRLLPYIVKIGGGFGQNILICLCVVAEGHMASVRRNIAACNKAIRYRRHRYFGDLFGFLRLRVPKIRSDA